jgi:hypothetical protein
VSIITQTKTLGTPTRLGSGTCAVLNVNAGSFHNPNRVITPGGYSQDLIMFGGELHAIHVEGDATITSTFFPKGQMRGPYVQKYSGGSWSLVGTTLCPDADSPPVDGGRTSPRFCRLATNASGTDLFACFYDQVTPDASDPTRWVPHIRIYRWNGASWVQVASESLADIYNAGGGLGGIGFIAGSGGTPSLVVNSSGIAYVAYQFGSNMPVRILRSDGSAMFVPNTFPAVTYRGDQNSAPTLAVQSDGRVVGAYAQANVIAFQGTLYAIDEALQYLVLFDADTGAELRRTPVTIISPVLMPYLQLPRAVNTVDFSTLLLNSTALGGYNGDKILIGESWTGGIIVPENGAGDFTTLSGGYPFGGNSRFCFDPTDATKRLAWFTGIPTASHANVGVWQPACSSTFTSPNSINPVPAHAQFIETGLPAQSLPTLTCLDVNPLHWALLGPCIPICDGTSLSVFWLYAPSADNGDDSQISNDMQWVVHSYPITTSACSAISAPHFGSRHKVQAP